MARALWRIKSWLVPSGTKPRVIKSGIFKGLKLNLDLRGQAQVFLGLWERETYSYIRDFTRQARTAIDVGTAEGEYALFFLSQSNIKHVFAFDPYESFPAKLISNLELNGLKHDDRLTAVKKYVSDHEDQDHCTLDSYAGIEGPCVVKIDVDGAEGTVLQGAGKLMDRHDVLWVIETHSLELERECIQLMTKNGLMTKVIKNAWWRCILPEGRSIPHNRWLAAWHHNNVANVKT